jgi:hypothetical protein
MAGRNGQTMLFGAKGERRAARTYRPVEEPIDRWPGWPVTSSAVADRDQCGQRLRDRLLWARIVGLAGTLMIRVAVELRVLADVDVPQRRWCRAGEAWVDELVMGCDWPLALADRVADALLADDPALGVQP